MSNDWKTATGCNFHLLDAAERCAVFDELLQGE